MRLSSKTQNHIRVISIGGDLVASECDQLRQECIRVVESRLQDIVLDCYELKYIDSVGLETLVWLQDFLSDHLGELKLINCSESMLTVLKMTRLNHRLECCKSFHEAVVSFSCEGVN